MASTSRQLIPESPAPAPVEFSAVIPGARPRLDAVDAVRGLIMALMALDHTRDFFSGSGMNPRDVHDAGLFLTRFVTHFCAPGFVFLAGVSAFLHLGRGRSSAELGRFLLTRGLWLMLLELTVVRFVWTGVVGPGFFFFQVIWAIGVSMVALSALVHLPRWAVAMVAVALVAGHNALDGIAPADLGSAGWLWTFLHVPGPLHAGSTRMFVLYPVLPWIGVMALGYAAGPVMRLPGPERRRRLAALGALLVVVFIALRATRSYGDPAPFMMEGGLVATVLSFINCEKYPPSLLYLLMTLGPLLLVLAAVDGASGRAHRYLVTTGRVPLFFYVAHVALIHLLAIGFALATRGDAGFLIGPPAGQRPMEYGLSLPALYLVWLLVLALLYPATRWYAELKQRRREWWWSYL